MTTAQRLVAADWLHTAHGTRLHDAHLTDQQAERIVDESGIDDHVRLCCGRMSTVWLHIPGLGTRLATPRCQGCCRARGYPQGAGSPKNDDACRALWADGVSA
jgi:hypothetical protein